MKKLKYSVVGSSWITHAFIIGAAQVDGLELDAVYSRTASRGEEFAAQIGAKRVFTQLEELCDSDTDCVYVASPNYAHYGICKSLLKSGKHVICEKPITVTPEEYEELHELAEKNGLIYIEAIMYMHTPVRDVLREAIGKIGKIFSANIDYSQLSSKYPALKRGELPNIFNPEMKAGALNDLGVYCVYPVVDIFGYPQRITARSHILHTGADACGGALFEYPDKLVTITYSKTGQSHGVSQFIGDNGTVTVESISQLTGVTLYDNDGNKTVLCTTKTKAELMYYEAQDFYNFITEPEKYSAQLARCSETALLTARAMDGIRFKA